ncbi:hypothetical protein LOTGIDRAFT_161986 [Lottia gigantea]|uniref:Uncharacterized protein n=1 Tax=Lottia gigantea TaxID=225164 RepID=V4ACY4_LOTGI|nr:hypothetical protein LOTGIDRAFT_161986 [Lottia gigantea]ESO92960.1 hypothetical protein LOTGIDRAFT_161986 [Lottia gigantea]
MDVHYRDTLIEQELKGKMVASLEMVPLDEMQASQDGQMFDIGGQSGESTWNTGSNRNILAFVYVPIMQKELDIFRKNVWNTHRGGIQKDKCLPAGVPEHIYHFPEKYGGKPCGRTVG